MLKLEFASKKDRPLRVLCIGAHCDDIEIGCGGTILRLAENDKYASFYWVVLSSNQQRQQEALASANSFLKYAKEKNVVIKTFRDGFFPFVGGEIKEFFETFRKDFAPDVIFTHYRDDLHQDHRLVSQLTWNTFRDHLILEYEIPKYDGDLGCPNTFVHLDGPICHRKIRYILKHFRSQSGNHWFAKDAFLSLLRLRGIESNAPQKYAEAFYCRKALLE